MSEEQEPEGFSLYIPFVVDGDGYSNRDRQMFVAGYEFCQLCTILQLDPDDPLERPIHRENEDRVRVMCSRFKRRAVITPIDDTWVNLKVE